MNNESKIEESPWRSDPPSQSLRYWCGFTIFVVFTGFIALAQTISIFVMGYEPRLVDWGYYMLNIVGIVAIVGYLWKERQKRRSKTS